MNTDLALTEPAARLERDRLELAARIERLTGRDGTHATALPALTLYRAQVPGVQLCAVYEPGLVLVAQGAKELQLGGETYRYDQANCLITSIDLPVSSQVVAASAERPYLCAMLRFDARRIGELLAGSRPAPAGGAGGRGIGAGPVDAPMMDAMLRLVRLLDSPADLPALAPLIECELLYRLLAGEQGPRLRHVATSGSRGQRVSHAIGWLKNHYREPLRIDALAEAVNMSASSLHHHFRALTAMSPLQYQKQLRLQEARRLLMARHCDVASAAHRVGYESPSQFSREYSRLFGAPPLRDVEQLRRAGAVPDAVPLAG
ncbi:AraC family transcriptional regulator [Frateuria sp. Soil773]|uniref:AraC family transcriptional regulator n=1 Tax=Frateuria sp. Soil773 TaxID=1736407 RepID=UPI0007016AFC|nr:AraC family transcriptional regulator [Frateuria sp. Soil773]KRE99556.1 AraC family transcriptional regulator [Frateuria sp. Soil773]